MFESVYSLIQMAQAVVAAYRDHARPNGPSSTMRLRNEFEQMQCLACYDIMNSKSYSLHANFKELEDCAENAAKCVACRVFRRAIIQAQITVSRVELLRSDEAEKWPIWASWDDSEDVLKLLLTVEGCSNRFEPAVVICTPNSLLVDSVHGTKRLLQPDYAQYRQWTKGCHERHTCKQLSFSERNPKWLIEILPPRDGRPSDSIQLVPGPAEPVKYVALSYSWGNPSSMGENEWRSILGNWTETQTQFTHRRQPFQAAELTITLQHAIKIARELGVQYIWIDSVCLPNYPKRLDWNVEATKMQEIFGNAYFTLFTLCAEKASDPLLGVTCKQNAGPHEERPEWRYRLKGCRIRAERLKKDVWLQTIDMSIKDLLERAPLAKRGWILQEELLSPRILYWGSGRAYWYCAQGPEYEAPDLLIHHPTKDQVPHNSAKDSPQIFLKYCYNTTVNELRSEWLSIISSYSLRELAQPKEDRLAAVAGLAMRYLGTNVETYSPGECEEYLAGLWRGNFAQLLCWSIPHARSPDNSLRDAFPSWSWASLPPGIVTFNKGFQRAESFRLMKQNEAQKGKVQDTVTRGALIKSVAVMGRMKPYLAGSSVLIGKAGVSKGHVPTHTRDLLTGEIKASQVRTRASVGRLDYGSPYGSATRPGCLKSGDERKIWCLEVGKQSMLLLESVSAESSLFGLANKSQQYRRVGICEDFPQNFFQTDVRPSETIYLI